MSEHDEFKSHFDPDQPLDERREVQRKMRQLLHEQKENQDAILAADPKEFTEMLARSDRLLRRTKQTAEAAADAKFVLGMAELAYKRSAQMAAGSAANGVDVDEFVSKCWSYMRQGRGIRDDANPGLSSTQRRRRTTALQHSGARSSRHYNGNQGDEDDDDDEDEFGDEGDMLNWAHFGTYACIPFIRRPALPGFLLGPLSVEKKIRKVGRRVAPLRVNSLREVRPEVLDPDHFKREEHKSNDLATICAKILSQLEQEEARAQDAAYAEQQRFMNRKGRDLTDKERMALYEKHGVRDTGGVDFIRFAVNPHSFSQTVENIFYISFLIRDGKVELDFDQNGLPSLAIPADNAEAKEGPSKKVMPARHQAIISIDQPTWREVVRTFNITESKIPHRDELEPQGPGQRGWYS